MNRPTYRIVVVDAAARTGVMLRDLLEEDGVAVEIHRDTRHVVAAVLRATTDLLILVVADVVDGAVGTIEAVTLLSALRRVPCCPPVVVMSGHDAREARGRAFALGALDYITTPIGAVELRARVGVALRDVRRGRGDSESCAARIGLAGIACTERARSRAVMASSCR